MHDQWRYRMLGEDFGPVTTEVVRELVQSGDLGPSDLVAPAGGEWRPLVGFPELAAQDSTGDVSADPVVDDHLASLLDSVGQGEVPSTGSSASRASRSEWYCRVLGAELGPFDFDRLHAMAAAREIGPRDEVRLGRDGDWQQARTIVGLFEAAVLEGAETSAAADDDAPRYYFEINAQPQGPVNWSTLRALASAGQLTPRDRIREGAQGKWLRAATAVGLFDDLTSSRSFAGLAAQAAAKAAETAAAPPSPVESSATSDRAGDAPTSAESPSAPAPPADKWSNFFDKVESREQKSRSRNPGSNPDMVTQPQKRSDPAIQTRPATQTYTPLPPAVSPAPFTPPPSSGRPTPAPPAFVRPAAPKASFKMPSLGLGSLAEKLGGLGGGDGVSKGKLAVLALGVAIAVFMYVPLPFGGDPGADHYQAISTVWQKALKLQAAKAPDSEWTALRGEASKLIDAAQGDLAPIVDSRGGKAPLAQRILWMVDNDTGPSGANGYLRKVLTAGPAAKAEDFDNGTKMMSEAAQILAQK
jgi:hypothetical protein